MTVLCFVCSKSFTASTSLFQHLKIMHPFIQRFECKQSNCLRSFSNIFSFKKHFAVAHCQEYCKKFTFPSQNLSNQPSSEHFSNGSSFANISIDNEPLIDDEHPSCSFGETQNENDDPKKSLLKMSLLVFISKLYANASFPRNLVQLVLNETRDLLKNIFSFIEEKLEKVPSREMTSDLNKIILFFDIFQSEHSRFKFLKQAGYFVPPKTFYIGPRITLAKISTCEESNIEIKKAEGQIISLRDCMKQYLELPDVFKSIISFMKTECSVTNNVVSSIFQGKLWRELQSKFIGKIVIPYYLYFDDFETCNALGSRAGNYKVGAVYISLSAIPPQFASLLENIMMAQLFYTSDRTAYGNEKIFKNLIQELQYLEQEGITITVGAEKYKVYFTLLLILGDNLGLNSILGFTESFQAEYFCRFCLATKRETQTQVIENEEKLRNEMNYEIGCQNFSHGIKEMCIWNSLSNFHVTKNISCDLMHDLLEGVLRYDMGKILNTLIHKKYFTLDHLNDRIKFFKFNEADLGNLFPQIKYEHLKKQKIIMSASEMLAFVVYFGFIIGDMVPENEPSWKIFILIHKILDILLSRSITESTLDYLTILIKEHHLLYQKTFNDNLKPKFHFLLHYPRIISTIGPVRSVWCMKYEAYHKVLKSSASVVTSRKNVILTLAIKQQLSFAHRIIINKGFCEGVLNYSSNVESAQNLSEFSSLIVPFMKLHQISSTEAISVRRVGLNNILYRIGLVVQTDFDGCDDTLVFGLILDIIIFTSENLIGFVISPFETIGFRSHVQGYEVKKTKHKRFILLNQLPNLAPYNLHYLNNGTILISSLQ